MGHNSWRAKVKRIEDQQRDSTDRELLADAVALVDRWNADLARRSDAAYGFAERARYPQFSPHIGAAIRAGKPFLRLLCPACRQHGEVDLRKVVRPDDFPIGAIYDAMVCTFGGCRGRGDNPPPIPVGLFARPDDVMGELREAAQQRLAKP